MPSRQEEKTYLHIDFPLLGAKIMERWGLPEELTTVTKHHFTPEAVEEDRLRHLALTIAAAYTAAEALFAPKSDAPEEETKEETEEETLPDSIVALAQARDAKADELAAYLHTRSNEIRAFAKSALAA